jgi:hypothetical protein
MFDGWVRHGTSRTRCIVMPVDGMRRSTLGCVIQFRVYSRADSVKIRQIKVEAVCGSGGSSQVFPPGIELL